jgi:hypothetical protein
MNPSPPPEFAISAILKGLVAAVVAGCVFSIAARVALPDLMAQSPTLVGIAVWTLALLVGARIALTSWKKRQRWWRHLAGRCLACGHDLPSSQDRCPQCGTPINSIHSRFQNL